MAEFLIQRWRLIEFVELTIDLYTLETLLAQFQHFLAVFTFAVSHDGREKITTRTLLHRHDPIDHVLDLLGLNRLTSGGAVRCADTRKQKAHVVVNFSNSADGRTRVFRRGFLFNRDGRR